MVNSKIIFPAVAYLELLFALRVRVDAEFAAAQVQDINFLRMWVLASDSM